MAYKGRLLVVTLDNFQFPLKALDWMSTCSKLGIHSSPTNVADLDDDETVMLRHTVIRWPIWGGQGVQTAATVSELPGPAQGALVAGYRWRTSSLINVAELDDHETVMFRSNPMADMGRLPAATAGEFPVPAQGTALDVSSLQHGGAGHVLGAVPGSRSMQHGECPRASHSTRVPGQGWGFHHQVQEWRQGRPWWV